MFAAKRVKGQNKEKKKKGPFIEKIKECAKGIHLGVVVEDEAWSRSPWHAESILDTHTFQLETKTKQVLRTRCRHTGKHHRKQLPQKVPREIQSLLRKSRPGASFIMGINGWPCYASNNGNAEKGLERSRRRVSSFVYIIDFWVWRKQSLPWKSIIAAFSIFLTEKMTIIRPKDSNKMFVLLWLTFGVCGSFQPCVWGRC